MIDETVTRFIDKQIAVAEAVVAEHLDKYSGKIGRELTNEETFALAIISGVPLNHTYICNNPDKYVVNMTTIPCAVVWNGEKFLVGTKSAKF